MRAIGCGLRASFGRHYDLDRSRRAKTGVGFDLPCSVSTTQGRGAPARDRDRARQRGWRRRPEMTEIFEFRDQAPLWEEPIEAQSRSPEDAAAKEIELGAAVHLVLKHLEPVDMPFDQS